MRYNLKPIIQDTVHSIRLKDQEKREQLAKLGLDEEEFTKRIKELDALLIQEFKRNEPFDLRIFFAIILISLVIYLIKLG